MTDEIVPLSTVDPADAERAVLGALVNDDKAWDNIGALNTIDFTDAAHRIIFASIEDLESKGKPVDLVTVSDQLRRHTDYPDHPNILDYVRHVADENFTSERIEHYARIVLNCSMQRQLRRACGDIIALIEEPQGRSPEMVLGEAERLILRVSDSEKRGSQDFVRLSKASSDSVDAIESRYEWVRNNPGKQMLVGTPTGFGEFDKETSGLQPGELVILAASPGMGKTSLAMNIAFNVAAGGIPGHEEDVVAVFSMEMSARQLADRMLAMVAEVDQTKLRTGRLDDANWKAIESAIGLLDKPNLYIYEVPAATPMLIRRMARRLRASHNNRLDLIVIDYLQLIPGDSQRDSNRNTELAVITRELKALANELETPVLCLSQLNRQGSKREAGDPPKLQELRDSGAIEQDADIVMFLFNAQGEDEVEQSNVTNAELKVAKNRNGRCFSMRLVFTKAFFRFLPQSHDDYRGETPQEFKSPT